jgi:hypothetical protein
MGALDRYTTATDHKEYRRLKTRIEIDDEDW